MSLTEPTDSNVHELQPAADPIMVQWARFRDQFAEAMDDGSLYTIEELEQRIATKRAFLFAGKASAIVGQVETYADATKGMHLLWACGSIPEIVSLLPGVDATARMMGCTQMLAEGPRAWERILKADGYSFFSVTLAKGL